LGADRVGGGDIGADEADAGGFIGEVVGERGADFGGKRDIVEQLEGDVEAELLGDALLGLGECADFALGLGFAGGAGPLAIDAHGDEHHEGHDGEDDGGFDDNAAAPGNVGGESHAKGSCGGSRERRPEASRPCQGDRLNPATLILPQV
jgi:hypothetical protein